MSSEPLMPDLATAPSGRQKLFLRYYTGFLMDLVVLNLFAEYSEKVNVDTFTTSVWAALVLQILLKVTIIFEHKTMDWFNARGGGGFNTFLKYFCAWLILFGSKFVILEALAQAFGDKVQFLGRWHGIITLIVVVLVMLLAEEIMVRIYRRLADKTEDKAA